MLTDAIKFFEDHEVTLGNSSEDNPFELYKLGVKNTRIYSRVPQGKIKELKESERNHFIQYSWANCMTCMT